MDTYRWFVGALSILFFYNFMERYTYLLLDLLTISIPLLRSFEPRIAFYKQWTAWLPAILLTGTFFIVWDVWFTHWQIWGFNERYLLGIYCWGLPLEEWLFFVAVPYACLFLYETIQLLVKRNWLAPYQKLLTGLLILGLVGVGIMHRGQAYTATTCGLTAAFLGFHYFYVRRPYLSQFYMAYLVMLIPFFIVNGILTGSWIEEPVVWYNDQANLGIRWGTIPIEDVGYGFLLILMNLTLYKARQKRSQHRYEPA
ncbi:MAG: lycopene cyclase domain-containing protein [Bacteroidota bacterium]